MTRDLRSDRWTCPNDRNLQLRSKLNAGWSCHTDKKTSVSKDTQLTENELNEIQKVLQRSQMVERNERDRVMKLVERLENMKKNASQAISSPNKCALCGDFFCMLGSKPSKCAFCHRTLCSKCCIDSQYTPENDPANRSRNASRRSSLTGSLIPNSKSYSWQCRLCSEQREFLKKSGAWFSKKNPTEFIAAEDDDRGSATSNSIHPNQRQSSLQNLFTSGSNLRMNLPTFSYSSFRFWNNKNEDEQMYMNEYGRINNHSTELLNLNNRTVSIESIQQSHLTDSPFSLKKNQDKFVYPNSNGLHSPNNKSPESPVTPSQRERAKDKFTFNTASSPFQNKFRKYTASESPSNMNKSRDKFVFPNSNGNLNNGSSPTQTPNSPISPSSRARSQDKFSFNPTSPFRNKFWSNKYTSNESNSDNKASSGLNLPANSFRLWNSKKDEDDNKVQNGDFENKKESQETESTSNNRTISSSSSQLSSSKISPISSRKMNQPSYEYDEETNQNMANYNYYSNIITNLTSTNSDKSTPEPTALNTVSDKNAKVAILTQPTTSTSKLFQTNPLSNNFLKASSKTFYDTSSGNNKLPQKSTESPESFNRLTAGGKNSMNARASSPTENFSNGEIHRSKSAVSNGSSLSNKSNISIKSKQRALLNNSIKSITNGILNNSLSASASSLNKGVSGKGKRVNEGWDGSQTSINSIDLNHWNTMSDKHMSLSERRSSNISNRSNRISEYDNCTGLDDMSLNLSVSGTSNFALSSAAASLKKLNSSKKN